MTERDSFSVSLVWFYNRKRLHLSLGYKTPIPFLQDWLTAQQMEKQVARTPPVGRRKTRGTSGLSARIKIEFDADPFGSEYADYGNPARATPPVSGWPG
jgi:hypothetical protein